VCHINGWGRQKLDYLWVNLSSTALAYAESLPDRRTRTYAELSEALEERFGDSRLADVYKAELRARQRKEGESIPALGQEIRHLVQYAYPGIGNEGVEELAIESFREALNNAEQRMSVHQSHPKNLEEAIQVAMDLEAWQISEKCRNSNEMGIKLRATKDDNENQMIKLMEKMDSLIQLWDEKSLPPERERSVEDRRRDFKCFSCGKPGHIAKNCFSKVHQPRNENEQNQGNESQSC
jgi:hypothetical protein